ncbi:MAG: hypothetical protein L3K14_01505 [Thermoplasmata archaeon]|nr:hypothetical protein [Thermoplasmata archaeon]
MRSTLSPKVAAPEPMPHGREPELTVDRVIPKKHRAEVLRALARAPAGLPHHTIQYDVVRGSSASTILNEFVKLGLAEWHDDLYFATAKGKDTITAYDKFRAVAVGSNGN